MIELDIMIEAGDWDRLAEAEALAQKAAEAALAVTYEAKGDFEASVMLTDDAHIQALNRTWRAKDKPTNVLSFPMVERDDLLALAPDGPPEMLGDIALAHETCAREAAEKGVGIEAHAVHLIIHGLLHLAGHDHEISPADADAMEALETKALALMGLADPYGGDQ